MWTKEMRERASARVHQPEVYLKLKSYRHFDDTKRKIAENSKKLWAEKRELILEGMRSPNRIGHKFNGLSCPKCNRIGALYNGRKGYTLIISDFAEGRKHTTVPFDERKLKEI